MTPPLVTPSDGPCPCTRDLHDQHWQVPSDSSAGADWPQDASVQESCQWWVLFWSQDCVCAWSGPSSTNYPCPCLGWQYPSSVPGCVVLWILCPLDNSHYSPETLTKSQMWDRLNIPSTHRLAGLEIDRFRSQGGAPKSFGVRMASALFLALSLTSSVTWSKSYDISASISSAVKWKSKPLLYLNHRVGVIIK